MSRKPWIDRIVPWLAVGLSAIAASISTLTLRDTQQERKASAAITLSIDNISGKIAVLRNRYDEFALRADDAQRDTELENDANAYIHYLEYVAELINSGSIDPAFIADVVKCHIRDLSRAGYRNSAKAKIMPPHTPNLDKFRSNVAPLDCPSI